MAYDKDKLYEQALGAIKNKNLFYIADIVAFLPCSKQTFYNFFPVDSDELNRFHEMLEDNKIKTKSSIRAKLFRSNKAGELLALYRLIATPEEHQKLNQSYVDHTTKGEKVNNEPATIIYNVEEPEGAE